MSHFSRNFPGYWVTYCPRCQSENSFDTIGQCFDCEDCGAHLVGAPRPEDIDWDGDGYERFVSVSREVRP